MNALVRLTGGSPEDRDFALRYAAVPSSTDESEGDAVALVAHRDGVRSGHARLRAEGYHYVEVA